MIIATDTLQEARMMETGQTVWLAFATERSHEGAPRAIVTRATVLDGENKVVKRDNGYVGVIAPYSVETVHTTEAAAWRACASELLVAANRIEEEAARCVRMASSVVTPEDAGV